MWAHSRATRGLCLVRLALAAKPAPAIRDCRRHRHHPTAAHTPHTTRLSSLLPAAHRPSSYHPDAPDCNALVRPEKPARCAQTDYYAGVRLPQPYLPLLSDHGGTYPCFGG